MGLGGPARPRRTPGGWQSRARTVPNRLRTEGASPIEATEAQEVAASYSTVSAAYRASAGAKVLKNWRGSDGAFRGPWGLKSGCLTGYNKGSLSVETSTVLWCHDLEYSLLCNPVVSDSSARYLVIGRPITLRWLKALRVAPKVR